MSSLHEVKVFKIGAIEEHGNADSLEVIRIGGYSCCVRIGQFKEGDLAAYVEPDTMVPVDVPEFEFLKDKANDGMVRIKAVKLRGVVSMGLLVAARDGWKEDDDVMDELGCVHYDPPIRGVNAGGENTQKPDVYHVRYDVESWRKYPHVIKHGENVVITEKVHGANSRFVFHDGKLYCGSHGQWKKEDDKNMWWNAAREYDLANKLAKYPDYVFYGEVYGRVQDLRYGAQGDDPPRLAFFDVMHEGRWLDYKDMVEVVTDIDIPTVEVLFEGQWENSLADHFSNGDSLVEGADHIREGCVVRLMNERWDKRVGRVLLKVVGSDYLMRKDSKRK